VNGTEMYIIKELVTELCHSRIKDKDKKVYR
jgi:hypothetical protein